MLKDITGAETTAGDVIAYAVKTKRGESFRVGRIVKIVQSKGCFGHHTVQTRAIVRSRVKGWRGVEETIKVSLSMVETMPPGHEARNFVRRFLKLSGDALTSLTDQKIVD